MTPPYCSPDCCCHDFAERIEALSEVLADVIKQRDDLLTQRDQLIAQVEAGR